MKATSLRSKSVEELRELFTSNSIKPHHQVVIIDELHQRDEVCPCSMHEFETILASLGSHAAQEIAARAHEFSLAVIFALERKLNKSHRFEWHVIQENSNSEKQALHQIAEMIRNGNTEKVFLWNRFMLDWKPLNDYIHWNNAKELIYQTSGHIENEKPFNVRSNHSSFPVVIGILSIVAFPFWLVFLFVALTTGFGSFIGPLLPAVFSVFMFVISIPMSIGLLRRKRWAWGMLVITSVFGLIWFGGSAVFDAPNPFWILLAGIELIILTFALTAKESFA